MKASFSQEGPPAPQEEESIEDLLADENIPEEIRKEIEEAMKSQAAEIPVEEYPPQEAEEDVEEAAEITPRALRPPRRIERSDIRSPEPPITPEIGEVSSSGDNKISLDLKGVDIIDVLKMLSARSDLNIVAGRNVRGRVTLFLKDVDVWDAFEIILAANSLAYEKEGDIINVMTERDYEQLYGESYYSKKELRIYRLEHAKAAEVSKALNQAKSKIGKVIIDESSNTIVLVDSSKAIAEMEKMIEKMDAPVETKVFSLNYAKAEDIKTKISEVLTKATGTMQVDERTNKIVVTDLAEKMPEITAIVEEMDEKHKEVLIETKIVQVSLNDQYRYGIDWTAIFRKMGDEGVRVNLDNFTTDVFTGGGTGGALTITSLASGYFDAAIQALETVGKTNVISSPRITVLNNEEAKVLVGTNQPYIEQTYITTESGGNDRTDETIKWVDVGVELTVTPTINEDGFVTMKIKPKISSADSFLGTSGERTAIPIVTTSETETTVMVEDGTTILIAGLIEDRDQETEEKIPFLGDIPLLGNLFKNRSRGSTSVPEKKELVVFLTPYIVHGTETFPEVENTWYGESITQKKLMENELSYAVEDMKKRRSLAREIPPPEKKKDTTTRFSEDLEFFAGYEDDEDIEILEARKTALEKKEKTTAPPPDFATSPTGGYYSYFENMRNRIYWYAKDVYPGGLNGEKQDVRVLFKLGSDGNLMGEPEVISEVDQKLAKAAKAAVEMAAPFPPFPRRMEGEDATFKITITYQ
jgi:MSHA type pilus biogenesis protein MshL